MLRRVIKLPSRRSLGIHVSSQRFRIIHKNAMQLIKLSGTSRDNTIMLSSSHDKMMINNPLENLLGSLIACQSVTAKSVAIELGNYIDEIIFVSVMTDYK